MVDVIMVASYSAVFLFYTNFPYIKLYLPESIQLFRRKKYGKFEYFIIQHIISYIVSYIILQ